MLTGTVITINTNKMKTTNQEIIFQTRWNYTGGNNRTEIKPNEAPSLTVPGEAKTIKELLARTQAGMPAPEERPPLYMDQPNMDLINHYHSKQLDLVDLDDLKDYNKRLTKALIAAETARTEAIKKEAEKKALEEARDAADKKILLEAKKQE